MLVRLVRAVQRETLCRVRTRCVASSYEVGEKGRIPLNFFREVCASAEARVLRLDTKLRGARWAVWFLVLLQASAAAQSRWYGGIMAGVATLSADARSHFAMDGTASFSLYAPESGLLLGGALGRDLSEYVALQGQYVWNHNQLTLSGSRQGSSLSAYEETRSSAQHSALLDVMVYFRKRDSRFRPYLAVGTGFVHFSSSRERLTQIIGAPSLPPSSFQTNLVALHVPVGIDVKVGTGWRLRYSFSETLTANPISGQLSPRGTHKLMNFQNTFVILWHF